MLILINFLIANSLFSCFKFQTVSGLSNQAEYSNNCSSSSECLKKLQPIFSKVTRDIKLDEICTKENAHLSICNDKWEDSNSNIQQNQDRNLLNIYIKTVTNRTELDQGSNLTLECHLNETLRDTPKIKLKWLRNGIEIPDSYQSFYQNKTDSPIAIIKQDTRIWTIKKQNSLDLEINDFQPTDAGSYFCQALSSEISEKVISDARIDLKLHDLAIVADSRLTTTTFSYNEIETFKTESFNNDSYSQENLSNLLPSLIVEPSFILALSGQSVRFICITSDVDQPDPDPDEIKWSYESVDRQKLNSISPVSYEHLPYNVTEMGNVLVVWSVSQDTVGTYKCSYKSAHYNLTTEAIGELMLSPNINSAPFVSVNPELVRIAPNVSTTIQCEASGFPAPILHWYRVDDLVLKSPNTFELNDTNQNSNSSILPNIVDENINFETIPYQDCLIYCDQHKCAMKNSNRAKITAISLIHINFAQAQHQGQYVCRAKNEHGSNQASMLLDIEFREPPMISIAEPKEHTVVLQNISTEQTYVSFDCIINSGEPTPKLKWLRTTSSIANRNGLVSHTKKHDHTDLYDLSKVTNVGSNITIQSVDNGKTLRLYLNKVSIEDEGDYICLAENEWGRQSASAHLEVRKPATIKIPHTSPYIANLNESFHLDCIVSGHPTPVDIEWSRSDRGAFFSLLSHISTGSHETHAKAMLKFDRMSADDSGEYTCNARDYHNSSNILRDTIMVIIKDTSNRTGDLINKMDTYNLMPKLIVRPTKIVASAGHNVTIDCLATGSQPTIVEWIGPPILDDKSNDTQRLAIGTHNIKPYYRTSGDSESLTQSHLLQFGSRLKITNLSKSHEGVYQCKGRNKFGVENAPALVKVYDDSMNNTSSAVGFNKTIRAKVASLGSNIELKCQVNGVENPVTSWSREGLELPRSSVQIKHNLWIQNVSADDSGLYICSAKSTLPNKVIQAKIKLMVRGKTNSTTNPIQNLTAKIIASKSNVNVGDSITLDCIISINNQVIHRTDIDSLSDNESNHSMNQESIDDIIAGTVWTNLHSGQSLFQDNVYTTGNTLIILELRPENSATYRCNYNELTQYVDYELKIQDDTNQSISMLNELDGKFEVDFKSVPIGSKVEFNCKFNQHNWFRSNQSLINRGEVLIFESVSVEDADIYYCREQSGPAESIHILQVITSNPRFIQKPFSFITLPTIIGADYQLDLQLKFLPEHETGLILFNGQQLNNGTRLNTNGDYILLGLNRGYLEFKFELGDGVTLLRSHKKLELNQWHKVVIERNLKGATMYVDKQPLIRNNSIGKFLNLNLDSVLYVGGHQYFMINSNKTRTKPFYGYPKGFKGCISSLKIFKNEINLMARNRGVSENIFECDKPECSGKSNPCNSSNSICQVDHVAKLGLELSPEKRASSNDDLKCICLPGFTGNRCDKEANKTRDLNQETATTPTPVSKSTPNLNDIGCQSTNCSIYGTSKCQSLTSTSFKCHCSIGFMGPTCSEAANLSDEISIGFNGQAYLQLRFTEPEVIRSYQFSVNNNVKLSGDTSLLATNLTFNQNFDWIQFARMTNLADNLNVSFDLQTKSSYGIIFYVGGHQKPSSSHTDGAKSLANFYAIPQTSKSMVANLLSKLSSSSGQLYVDYLSIALVDGHLELSFELGSGVAIIRSSQRINDGNIHRVQVSRSGRFGKLVIDEEHKQEGSSPGKLSVLNSEPDIYLGGLPHIMPDLDLEPNSSGGGGGGTVSSIASVGLHATTTNYLSSFVGCLSNLKINSLGPFNLIRSSLISLVKDGRNLVPCYSLTTSQHNFSSPNSVVSIIETQNITASSGKVNKTKPYQATPSVESDDPDEM